jgi:hypothetical protein
MGKMIDMTGWVMKEHGVNDSRITIMYKSNKKDSHGCYWHCKCECGNEFETRGSDLRNGRIKSCGCFKKELLIKNGEKTRFLFDDLTGQDFDYWHVDGRAENTKQGNSRWHCTCKCGTKKIIYGSSLKKGTSRSCGCMKESCGEQKIRELLEGNDLFFEQEKRFDDCKDKFSLPFDFYVDNKYIIEFDGEQHFKSGSGWNTEEQVARTQKHDKIKNQYCFEHDIPIIRIPYTHLDDLCLNDLLLETSEYIIKAEGE